MRLKLILIVSGAVSIAGAAGAALLLYLSSGSIQFIHSRGFGLVLACIAPAAAVIFGAFFIYRHTARRRILQALLTVVISVFFILTLFLASVLILGKRTRQISFRLSNLSVRYHGA